MNKKAKNIVDRQLLKMFFQYRLNLWIVVSVFILIACVAIFFLAYPKLTVLPGINNYEFSFYTDNANGGNSEILGKSVSDSTINLEFNLKQGFLSPYVGFSISPKNDSLIKLPFYNQLLLTIESKKKINLGVSIYTCNPYKKYAANSPELCFSTNIEITPDQKEYAIDFKQLKIPDWWVTSYNIPTTDKIKPDLKEVLRLTIGTAHNPILDTKQVLKINSIEFDRNNKKFIALLIAIELALIVFHFFALYLKSVFLKKNLSVTITYKPVVTDTENRQFKSFLDYINTNFQESDLSLEKVAGNTRVSERQITHYIQQNFGCNFKHYINQIRINEAKRLLNESELNIGEIAFKVGFGNQSHFNRVFKSYTGTSPSEFKINKK